MGYRIWFGFVVEACRALPLCSCGRVAPTLHKVPGRVVVGCILHLSVLEAGGWILESVSVCIIRRYPMVDRF